MLILSGVRFNPAIAEINAKTDVTIRFRELKAKGSKAVERLAFSIRGDPCRSVAGRRIRRRTAKRLYLLQEAFCPQLHDEQSSIPRLAFAFRLPLGRS